MTPLYKLVNIFLEIFPGVYNKHVCYKGGQKILYVRMFKSFNIILVSSILYNKSFRNNIEGIGFEIIPYDSSITNMKNMVSNKQ